MWFYFQSTFVWDSNNWEVKQQFSFHQGKEDKFIFKTLINSVCHKTEFLFMIVNNTDSPLSPLLIFL